MATKEKPKVRVRVGVGKVEPVGFKLTLAGGAKPAATQSQYLEMNTEEDKKDADQLRKLTSEIENRSAQVQIVRTKVLDRAKEELLFKKILKEQRKYSLNINWESPDRIMDLVPGINPKGLRGGTYSPDDGQINPLMAAEAFGVYAKKNGADFLFDSEVTGLTHDNSLVTGVSVIEGVG